MKSGLVHLMVVNVGGVRRAWCALIDEADEAEKGEAVTVTGDRRKLRLLLLGEY